MTSWSYGWLCEADMFYLVEHGHEPQLSPPSINHWLCTWLYFRLVTCREVGAKHRGAPTGLRVPRSEVEGTLREMRRSLVPGGKVLLGT